MSNMIDDNGNTIQGSAKESGKCSITFKGKNNRLTFGKDVTIENVTISFSGNNGSLHIDDNAKVIGLFNIGDNCHIFIGKETKFNKPCRFITQEGAGIRVGTNCLFANVKLRTSDSHSIIDVESGRRINPAKEIVIGNNVWIAEDVKVYKGASVGDGAIIGAGSILTSTVPAQSLAVGIPAKVVKRGVTWLTERLPVSSQPTRSEYDSRTISRGIGQQPCVKNIATFGSSLARQVANNYAQLFDGKVISSVCHNRSDYFCNQLLLKQTDPETLTELLATPFPEQLLSQDREDNIVQMLKNQAMETIGLHRLSKGVNFFHAIESGLIDLLVIDNGIDLTAKLSHTSGYEAEPFMIQPEYLDTLPTRGAWTHGKQLNPDESAIYMAKILSHVKRYSPQTKIVFIQAVYNTDIDPEYVLSIYEKAFDAIDCHLLPVVSERRPSNASMQLYATYAGMIKGLELI